MPPFLKDAPAMIDPRVASGLRDIPPSAMIPRERMLAGFRTTFASFGYLPIETPHIERMEVLTGKGAGSDEVLRQIFEVTNKGGTPGELALRFDLTVPLARFIAKNVNELGVPFKRYAIGSVFRGERPAKGRFREFLQCDFDTVGTESAVADAETAQVIHDALVSAQIPEFTIALNNRKILDGLLDTLGVFDRRGQILRIIDKRDKIGPEAMGRELRGEPEGGLVTDSQASAIERLIAPSTDPNDDLLERASKEVGEHPRAAEGISNLRTMLSLLDSSRIPRSRLKIDLGLARGLDYYTGVVFETTVNGWERFGSISSGGRYDNLASLFTERRLPGVGASIGLDRLLALLEEAGHLKGATTTAQVLVANFPGVDVAISARLAARLRASGVATEIFPDPIQIGKQMGYGSTRGHKLALIVGPDEHAREVFNLRNLTTRAEQKAIPWNDLESAVQQALSALEGSAP
jgi:histidyl-tRNA synthetase